jgi:hypothetical protein
MSTKRLIVFLVLAMGPSGSIARADSSTAKPSAPARGPVHLAKVASPADPFEEASSAAKAGAPPAAATPTKPAAAPAVAAAQNRPSKEMQVFMKGLEGSWKCETTFAVGSLWPGSQQVSAKTDITIRKEFGGFSWHGEFKLAPTATTAATNGMFQIGYASGVKQATFLSYDSVGTAMMGAGSLAGDSVTFAEEGFLKGAKVRVRETLAAKGPKKLYHKVEIDQGTGYQSMAEDTCSK